jgi:hypothetical protein
MYMEVVMEPNIVSDHIKAFLDDPQWLSMLKILSGEAYLGPLIEANQEANFFKYLIILGIF